MENQIFKIGLSILTFALITGVEQWLGISIPNGDISCSNLQDCNGKKIWSDGTIFNASLYSSISNIQVKFSFQIVCNKHCSSYFKKIGSHSYQTLLLLVS